MTARRAAVAAVWVATAAGVLVAVLIGNGRDVLAWLALTLTLSVVAGMVAQLLVGEQHGFVIRLATSACGSFALVLVGAVVAVLTR